MPFETTRVTIIDTPQDLGALAGLTTGSQYVVHNEAPSTRIFFADATDPPMPGGPAFPIPPGGTQAAQVSTPLKLWAWCEAGETASLVIGGTTQ